MTGGASGVGAGSGAVEAVGTLRGRALPTRKVVVLSPPGAGASSYLRGLAYELFHDRSPDWQLLPGDVTRAPGGRQLEALRAAVEASARGELMPARDRIEVVRLPLVPRDGRGHGLDLRFEPLPEAVSREAFGAGLSAGSFTSLVTALDDASALLVVLDGTRRDLGAHVTSLLRVVGLLGPRLGPGPDGPRTLMLALTHWAGVRAAEGGAEGVLAVAAPGALLRLRALAPRVRVAGVESCAPGAPANGLVASVELLAASVAGREPQPSPRPTARTPVTTANPPSAPSQPVAAAKPGPTRSVAVLLAASVLAGACSGGVLGLLLR